MSAIVTIGIDLAKNVFAVHGADVTGKSALIGKARRLGNRLLADDQTTEDERKCVVAAGEKGRFKMDHVDACKCSIYMILTGRGG